MTEVIPPPVNISCSGSLHATGAILLMYYYLQIPSGFIGDPSDVVLSSGGASGGHTRRERKFRFFMFGKLPSGSEMAPVTRLAAFLSCIFMVLPPRSLSTK